ncbi:unnamed protein product [Plutella xylostella]|uniref:(diamondback moth) hypothetical protein n=1 Tax=Plutella xylostella TaxID=51655 RepID=A0A8S4DZW5_PLUXY|nr:unnamed protein product [Plutella xylostella]
MGVVSGPYKMVNVGLVLLFFCAFVFHEGATIRLLTTDELENHISPEDLKQFEMMLSATTAAPGANDTDYADAYADLDDEDDIRVGVPATVDCFGLGPLARQLRWFVDMRPDSKQTVNTHYYFMSRSRRKRVQVLAGEQFGLEWVDFDPQRKTVLIVHGFMSHSNASWVNDMAAAFLQWKDMNVIAVDWSGGGNTWKYWKAVANTRRVGADVTEFLEQLMNATGARMKDFHLVGHSLGAHICSYVSYHLGGVSRITGLDPAQPCFRTSDLTSKLDTSDADFVDVIHTNGRLLKKIGFGLPEPIGHADFYPNGGMKQPGCRNKTRSFWSRVLGRLSPEHLQQAICSHGRAYLLFTESLINNNCTFRAHRWNLTYEGVNSSIADVCDKSSASCATMGIDAFSGGKPKAKGAYFVLTTEKEPFCPSDWERAHPRIDLLRDFLHGFQLIRPSRVPTTPQYAEPDRGFDPGDDDDEVISTTTQKSWYRRWFG